MVATTDLASSANWICLAILGAGLVRVVAATTGAKRVSLVNCGWLAILDRLVGDPIKAIIGTLVDAFAIGASSSEVEIVIQLW